MQLPTINIRSQGKHGQYNAVDYSAKPNPIFYAPESGKITAYGKSGTCGNRLELTGKTGRHGFCHLEKPLVKVGQKVVRGQKIGVMGYTGYTIPKGVKGRHLHWVLLRNGKYVYPPTLATETFRIFKLPAVAKPIYYIVRKGDYLARIAVRFGTTVAKLVKLNKLKNPNLIRIGQRLRRK